MPEENRAAPAPDSPRPASTRRRWVLPAAGAALLVTAGVAALFFFVRYPESISLPRDPRLEYSGPFRNVHPAVRYVPEERCAECHAEKAATYAEHPMGRSLLPIAKAAVPPADAAHHNPFDALGSRFLVERAGDRVRHRRTRPDKFAAELAWEVHYAIGSGAKGYSYLTDRDGYLLQTPISWYTQKGVWDLSPGFGEALLTGRRVVPDCLFCHANRANYVDGSVNRYRQPAFDGHAIGCQRCHGPGELHIVARTPEEPRSEDPDYTIVNPRRLEWPLREAVCEQCHLEGELRTVRHSRGLYDFRPGLPLERFLSAFVRAAETGEGHRAVGHVEQMYQSRCFQASDGQDKLGCISCHDPHEHVPPSKRVAHYRGRCLECHQQRGCSRPPADRLRRMPDDSCIDCHMPRYGASDIPHTASTDHRIPRNAERGTRNAESHTPRAASRAGEGYPFVSFYRERKAADEAEDARDRAVALVKLTLGGEASALRVVGRTLPALDAAVRRDPDDLPAAESRAYTLGLLDRHAEALAAFEEIMAKAPSWEMALVGAASTAEMLGRTEAALAYWRRAVAANPVAPDYRRSLVLLLVKNEAWAEAGPEGEAWLRLDPFSAEGRIARVQCLLAAGRKDEARAEFARVEALAPKNLRELQARFQKKLR